MRAEDCAKESEGGCMTRAEAIKRLKEYSQYAYGIYHNEQKDEEAFNMAIEALHREEAEEKGYCHRIRPSNVEVVVRCKDCRWYDNRYGDVCHNPRYGDGHANYQPPYVDEDYWCKDGERKGGEDE